MLPLKQQIKERDKICLICGGTDNLTVDHIIPLAEGGADDFSNLRTLCFKCNSRKGPIPPLWQRIVNLFNGNIYWFKADIRHQTTIARNEINSRFETFKQSYRDQAASKFKDYDTQIRNVEATNKIMVEKYNSLLKDNQALWVETTKQSERIIHLQKLLEVEWVEETRQYVKIKKPRGRPKK